NSWNAEAGVKQFYKFGNLSGFADIAGFRQEYENFVEFNAGQWGTSADPAENLGFKFLNTGRARVTGCDFSFAGQWKKSEDSGIDFYGGYTFSLPVTLEPDYYYYSDTTVRAYFGKVDTLIVPLSYRRTASDTTGHILKYRIQHLAKLDIEVKRKKLIGGISARYYSYMRNIDKFFYSMDELDLFDTGIASYREINNDGTFMFDCRIGYAFKENIRLSLVVNNMFNKEFSLRPLTVESPRTIALQFILKTG
ncbi:MAG: TonB-dependent receptor, partial [Bacteroidetes bacterium]|nr:TonB-dependent receptor [Bacteroidota bacterium]